MHSRRRRTCRAHPCGPGGPGRSTPRWPDGSRPSGPARRASGPSAVTSCSATVDFPAPGAPVRPRMRRSPGTTSALAHSTNWSRVASCTSCSMLTVLAFESVRWRVRSAMPAARPPNTVVPPRERSDRCARRRRSSPWVEKYEYAPWKASPAPSVSTTTTGSTGTEPDSPSDHHSTGSPPWVVTTVRTPLRDQRRGGGIRVVGARHPEVVGAHHVRRVRNDVAHHRFPSAGVDDERGSPCCRMSSGGAGDQGVVPVDEHHVGIRRRGRRDLPAAPRRSSRRRARRPIGRPSIRRPTRRRPVPLGWCPPPRRRRATPYAARSARIKSATGSSPSAVTRIASPPSAAKVTAAFAAGPPAATNCAVDVIFWFTAGAFAMR